jgi:hypothetical protein
MLNVECWMFPSLRRSALSLPLIASLLLGCPILANAQLTVLADNDPQQVFVGPGWPISLRVRNDSNHTAGMELRTHLYQTTSATALSLGEAPWKRLELLPGQTILESAALDVPDVKAETRFLIQWLAGSNTVIGTTEVLAYPTNLLSELKPLAGEEPVGVLDPANQLKPLLKALAVEFADLEDTAMEDYRGKLAIAGPFQTKSQMPEGLASRLQALARKGVGVVWIQPPAEAKPRRPEPLKPSFYLVPEGKGAIVVAQSKLVAGLADTPQAQLNFLQFARQALHPEPPRLPFLTP